MSFLNNLAKRAQQLGHTIGHDAGAVANTASRVYDQVNPLDNGLSYQTRQVAPNVPQRSIGQQLGYQGQQVGTAIGLGGVRSAVGTAQGLSGLYDLVTPGMGTNRFSNRLNNYAKFVDQTAKNSGVNNKLYHGSQAGTDLLQFFVGSGEAKAAATVAGKLPIAAKVGERAAPAIAKYAQVEKRLLPAEDRLGRVARTVYKNAVSPTQNAANAIMTANYTGQNASKGGKTTAAQIAKTYGQNMGFQVGAPLAGRVIGETAPAVANTVLKGADRAKFHATEATGKTFNGLKPQQIITNPNHLQALDDFQTSMRDGVAPPVQDQQRIVDALHEVKQNNGLDFLSGSPDARAQRIEQYQQQWHEGIKRYQNKLVDQQAKPSVLADENGGLNNQQPSNADALRAKLDQVSAAMEAAPAKSALKNQLATQADQLMNKITHIEHEGAAGTMQKLRAKQQLPKPPSKRSVLDNAALAAKGMVEQPTDPLAALKQEALNYKSADEFKAAFTGPDTHRGGMLPQSYLKEPKKLYRGVSNDGSGVGSAGEGLGLYTTTDKKTAMGYAKNGGKLLEMNPETDIPKNPLYFRNADAVRSWVTGVAQKLNMRVPEFNEKIGIEKLVNSLGHDGVAFDHGNGVAYSKYAEGKTDLYNQAHATPTKKRLLKPLDQNGSTPVNGPLIPVGKLVKENPDALPKGINQRSFPQTVIKNGQTTPELAAGLYERNPQTTYRVRNTKQLGIKAKNFVNDNFNEAMRVGANPVDDKTLAISQAVADKLMSEGKHEAAIPFIENAAKALTKSGQMSQAASLWGRLTPTGAARFAQRQIDMFNEGLAAKGSKERVQLTPEHLDAIKKQAQKVQDAAEGDAQRKEAAKLMSEIAKAVPATLPEKLSTLQTMAQLLNPKTNIRNVGGNGIFANAENLSQTIGTAIDKGVGTITHNRTTTLPNLKTQFSSFKKGGQQAVHEAFGDYNTGPSTQYELADVPTFRNGILHRLEQTMNATLRGADRAAYQAAFDDSIRGSLKLAKTDKISPEMLEQANHTALQRTFQDENRYTQLFQGLKGALNHVGIEQNNHRFGLGDLVIKYPKTPANLMKAGVDYSPAGAVNALFEMTKPLIGREFNQKAFVDSLSRSIVGSSAAVGTGYLLSKAGIITAQPSQDKDLRALQKRQGLGGYQINVSALKRYVLSGFNKDAAKLHNGDSLMSYDWAQPISIPLSVGASLGSKHPTAVGKQAADTVASAANTLVEQPLLTGVQKVFGGSNPAKSTVQNITDTVAGLPASFVPTALNQINQLTNNTTRNTDGASKNPIINTAQSAINQVYNKVPGLSNAMQPNVDVMGQPQKRYVSDNNNPLNVFLNPAFINKYNADPNAQLPLDIYNRSGETKQVPTVVKNSQKINGQNMQLTPKQKADLQTYVGQHTNTMIQSLRNDPNFMAQNDIEKSKAISGKISDIQAAGRVQVLGNQIAKNQQKAVSKVQSGNYSYTKTGTTSTTDLYKSNDAEYKALQAKYKDTLNDPKTPATKKYELQRSLNEAKIGASYSKNVRDLYGMGKTKLADYTSSNQVPQADINAMVAYGDALQAAGLGSNKYRDSKGNVSVEPKAKGTSTSSGRKSTGSKKVAKAKLPNFKTTNSANLTATRSIANKVRTSTIKSSGSKKVAFSTKIRKTKSYTLNRRTA